MRSRVNTQRLRQFLLLKEVVMISLIVISFVLLGLEHFETLDHETLLLVDTYEVAVAIIFLLEFCFELYYSKNWQKYLRYHWFYLFAAIPIPTESFELLKGIRALRLLKLFKIFAHMRYEENTHLFEESRG